MPFVTLKTEAGVLRKQVPEHTSGVHYGVRIVLAKVVEFE